MRLTLRQLQVFAAIARHENVSRAADALAMSQSAASSALVELERQFERPLFDRIGKSLRLNATGHGLRPMAESLLTEAARIEHYLDGNSLEPLSVGATLTIGNYLATLIMGDYLRESPAAQLRLHVANTREIVQQVLSCELDLGLIEGEAHDPNLLLTPWLNDQLVVFCAPDHPLARHGAVDNAQLAEQAWIVRESGSGTRDLIDRMLFSQLPHYQIRLTLEHTEAIKRAVESGLGIGCLSRLALREAFRRGSLTPINVPELDLQRRFHFVWHTRKHQTRGLRAFVERCRNFTAGARRSDEINLPYIP